LSKQISGQQPYPKFLVVVDADRCKGCEECIVACPEKNLKLYTSFNQNGYHPIGFSYHGTKGDCTGCGICYWVCPDFAIAEIRSLKKA